MEGVRLCEGLRDAIKYLDEIYNFSKNRKNRKLYSVSYGFYKDYKKLCKKIDKRNKEYIKND